MSDEVQDEQQVDEIVVSIGDQVEGQAEQESEKVESNPFIELRKQHREQQRKIRELEKQLQQNAPEEREPELGAKPTLEEMAYDTDKYEKELASWYDGKRKADERAAIKAAEEKQAADKWQAKMNSYSTAKSTLGVQDFEDAESFVQDLLNPVQQGIIVQGAKDSALVIYAIGKNEEEAKKLAAIKDPVEFAFAVARLEATLKVTGKKPATAPETRISGNSRPSGATDSTLERLRAKAEKTGDYSEINAYRRQKR